MLGAIAGDIIGSLFEGRDWKSKEFRLFDQNGRSRFTDDTVMTVATAEGVLDSIDFSVSYRKWGRAYPNAGYGPRFGRWLFDDSADTRDLPGNSFGNGSAMRVSPIGHAYGTIEETLAVSRKSAECTHNHPEGIKGAQAVAAAIFLARTTKQKRAIREYITSAFGYDLDRSLDGIRPDYAFDTTCPGSVPEAITAFLESSCFEDAIRNAVSLGGDSDTIAAITGSIAEAFYGGVPEHIEREVRVRLPSDMISVIDRFYRDRVLPVVTLRNAFLKNLAAALNWR